MFAELGADVIKVEPIGRLLRPGASGPSSTGCRDPTGAVYFIAYQAGKRSITLNLDRADGCRAFADLVAVSDFVVESSGPDYLDERGIGYAGVVGVNPAVIYTTITPFGERGPAAHWRPPTSPCGRAGGMMFLTGLPGRPPLQISVPQAYLHAGAEAATASMLAHFARLADGKGQRVVIDTQACVVWTLMNEQAYPLLHGEYLTRSGVMVGIGRSGAADGLRRGRWPGRRPAPGRVGPADGRMDGRGRGGPSLAAGRRLEHLRTVAAHGRGPGSCWS